jgi:2-polyprenyl-6-methoxyphenol hydroxylase-like FAD-dependent oxidoreductase
MSGKSILISGAGIAGPTLAYWLMAYGLTPTLVERAPRPRTGGYVIDFWGLGYDVAEKMGLLPELRRRGYDVRELRLVDDRGRRVGGFDAAVFRELTGGRYVSLARSELALLLYEKIKGRCEILFGDGITEIEERDDGVHVAFEHASERTFDLVIGADGLHSEVRRLVFGTGEWSEKYLGYMVAAFQADGYRPRDDLAYVSYALPGRQVARFAMRGDRTMFLFVFTADAPPAVAAHDTAAQKAVLRAKFGDAGWECPQILAALDDTDDLYFDRVSQIHMGTWSKGRVALTGDAAFCVSLLAGQGSALAMAAAYVLAGELGHAGAAPETAFQRYEQILRPLIATKQKAAAQFAGSFAPKSRLGLFVRNQVTKTLALPFVAKLVLGPSLLDHIDLPDYSGVRKAPPVALSG